MDAFLLSEVQLSGLRRLKDKEFRWWWAAALLLLKSAAISVLLALLWRFEQNPTRLLRTERYTTSLNMPSVMICPEINYPDHRIDAFLDEVVYPPGLNRSYIKSVVRQLAAFISPDVYFTQSDLENIERLLKYNNLSIRDISQNLTSSCDETLIRCRWNGNIMDCSSLFNMDLSEFGYCCVFNGRSLKREMQLRESGVRDLKIQPEFSTNQIGYKSGLMFVVNQSRELLDDIDLSYKWLILSTSHHFIESINNGTPISPGKEVWIGHGVERHYTEEETRFLSPSLRGCQFSNEPLKYFPTYHEKYCVLECGLSDLLDHCGCVMINHPAPASVPRCNGKNLLCARIITAEFTGDKQTRDCNCRPTCDVETGSIEISDHMLNPDRIPIDNFYEGLNYSKVTIIKVFIQRREIYQHRRQSYFTQLDLFAQMGGIFNVFFGCSILSLLEVAQLIWYKVRLMNRHRNIMKDKVIIYEEQKITKKTKSRKKLRFKRMDARKK